MIIAENLIKGMCKQLFSSLNWVSDKKKKKEAKANFDSLHRLQK